MGHRRKSTIYKLMFDDSHGEELSGLEITCRGASHDQLFDIASLSNIDLENLVGPGLDKIRALCHSFPDRIIDWNHEDEDGTPLAATVESFLDEDYSFTLPIVIAWVNTIRANPKSASMVSSTKQTFTDEQTPEDLSDLPMTIA
jgi:hypothetical protein